MNIQKVFSTFLSLLYPPVCPVCGEILTRAAAADENPYICSACYPKISFPAEPRCLLCSRPLFDEREELCPDCKRRRRNFDQSASMMLHDEVSKKIIYDLKYHNRKDNARMLAFEAAQREGWRVQMWHIDVIIPVPLHKKRQISRGYNQAQILAEQFARSLSLMHPGSSRDISVDSSYLVRTRRTKAQKELSGEQRKANIRDAFAISYRERPDKYLFLNDPATTEIYTSGATLSECARVLKCHGAKCVYCFTFGIG